MDNIEEKFFKMFGIEPKWKDKRVKNTKTYYTEEQAQYLRQVTKNRNIQLVYPQITDRILLELICILNKFNEDVECCTFLTGNNIEELKKSIFQECFDINSYIREQVRSLFEGVEE